MQPKPVQRTPEIIQVNINSAVEANKIRRETYNGREHIVVPSRTLPFDCVMNKGLYTKAEIVANYQKLEGTLAPLGHPTLNGQHVSAFSPEGLNMGHIGAWNRNVKLVGNSVHVEKWIDVNVAKSHEGGRRLLERLEKIEAGDNVDPIHTSVAVFLDREPAVNTAAGYEWVARITSVDHDAILLDQPGAATPAQGVGLMVNAEDARPLIANAGVFRGESMNEQRAAIEAAARKRFAPGPDDMVWIEDWSGDQAIIHQGGFGNAKMYGYRRENGEIVFDDLGIDVEQKTNWVEKAKTLLPNAFNSLLHSMGIKPNEARPQVNKDDEMPLTEQERADLAKQISEGLAANLNAAVATAIKPLSDNLAALQANHKELSDTLTANSKAAEADKRAVVEAKLGKLIANSLTGEALDDAFRQCGTAAPLGKEASKDANTRKAPDVNSAEASQAYFGMSGTQE